jgi:hypothetical protein
MRPFALLAAAALAACSPAPQPPAAIPRVATPEQLAERLPEDAAGFRRGISAPITEPFPRPRGRLRHPQPHRRRLVQLLAPPGAPSAPPLADGPSSPAVQAEYARWRDDTARGTARIAACASSPRASAPGCSAAPTSKAITAASRSGA